jgi:hypothetical protein
MKISLSTRELSSCVESVAMVGIDYEHDRLFSRQELSEANAVLIAHWKAGGLVTINWAPFNPWVTQDNGVPCRR